MFKKLHLLDGDITSPILKGDSRISVDVDTFNYVQSNLSDGDWTYAILEGGCCSEVVQIFNAMRRYTDFPFRITRDSSYRVTRDGFYRTVRSDVDIDSIPEPTGSLFVRRAVEGTDRCQFAEGEAISFVTTMAGIRESVDTGTPLTLQDGVGVSVGGQVIGYDIDIQGLGTAVILDQWAIGYDGHAGGCCESRGEAPPIPMTYYPYRITRTNAYRITRDNSYRTVRHAS